MHLVNGDGWLLQENLKCFRPVFEKNQTWVSENTSENLCFMIWSKKIQVLMEVNVNIGPAFYRISYQQCNYYYYS